MAQHCPNWAGLGTTAPPQLKTMRVSMKSSHSSGTIPPYIGPLQASIVRAPKAPMVVFEKGGSDFRTPANTSSLGRMCESKPHMATAGTAKFALCKRFIQDKYRSPGPIYPGQSSIGKQVPSHMVTEGGVGFGTSTRAGALKLYATYTA